MNITPKCLLKIKQFYPDLNGKYKAIADYILNSPEQIVKLKVREIARKCNCDDSLIIRFCQKIGYKGFSELKMSIASEFMPIDINISEKEITPGDSFSNVLNNFLENNNKVMHDTISLINADGIDKAAQLLSNANKILVTGTGASGLVAMDTKLKLLRLGFNVLHDQDSGFKQIMLELSEPGDAILAISYSGENSEICKLAAKGKEKGVSIIGLTNFPNSTLAGICDVTLLTASNEKVFRLGAMTSRIAQYLVMDFLILYMALKNIDDSEAN